MANKKILLVGGGGHCRSVLDSLLSLNEYDEIGIIDRKGTGSEDIFGVPMVGTDADLERLFREGWTAAFVTVGSVGNTSVRRRIFDNLNRMGFSLPCIVDPTAVLGRSVTLERGVYIGKCAVVNACAHLGDCVIINSGAIVEHDCRIDDFVHVSPGCILCGAVQVGNDSHIGAGSVVRQQISIGANTVIGSGGNVVEPIPDNAVAYGNPCKVVKMR